MPEPVGYFQPAEFACKCGRKDCDALKVPSPDLLARLNVLRLRLDRPLTITSGIRCAYWNEKSGGVKGSGHETGEEVDLACATSQERWRLLAGVFESTQPLFRRIGVGKTFIHLGVSTALPNGVIWTYYPKEA